MIVYIGQAASAGRSEAMSLDQTFSFHHDTAHQDLGLDLLLYRSDL